MTLPKETRYQSVKWILAKKSTIGKEAHRHKVSQQAVKNWITRYKKETTNAGTVQDAVKPMPNPANHNSDTSQGNAGQDGSAIQRALESAGFTGNPEANAGAGPNDSGESESGIPSVDIDPPDPPMPEIKPEDLVAFSELIVTKIPETYAAMRGIEIPSDKLAFTEKERQSLMLTAPYACQFAPPIMAKMPVAMACVFLGTLVLSAITRLGMVKRIAFAQEQAKHEIVKARQDSAVTTSAETSPVSKGGKDEMGFPQ